MSKPITSTNTELLNALHEAASDLSYYNAAEGEMWRKEAVGRGMAQSRWTALVEEAIHRGIYNKEDFKSYLV